jgi:alkylation response protein AidB-like acyl-CoA dehydrogenase
MYSAVIAAKHPTKRVREMFSDPLANVTGSGNGEGVAEPVEGGYRVSGRWNFTSGCTLATHLAGYPKISGDPDPFGVAMLAPASQVRVSEAWDVVGLAGTGSHQIEFDKVFVPYDMTHRPFDGESEIEGGPAGLAQGHWWDSCVAAAVELGLAKHVLSEVWALARVKPSSKLPAAPTLSQDSATLRVLQWSRGILFAQEAAMEKSLDTLWARAEAGVLTPESRVAFTTAAVTAVHESKRAIDMAYEISGTDGLQNAHELSRLIRDAQAMPLHAVARKARFETLGRLAEGDERFAPFI